MNAHWERHAEDWVRWARTPGFDAYWTHSGPPFFELVPPPGRATLDIGCGEGRVARDLARRGHRVTGVDASPTLVHYAAEAHPGGEYVVADAAALPFEGGAFDVVVAFNSLMDVDDMPGLVREAARVLERRGAFCVSITHPLADSGRFVGDDFVVRGSYYGRRRFGQTIERGGIRMDFRGWCYPLEDYARAFEDAGFVIEALREPPDPGGGRMARIPNFLQLRLRNAR